ncbi:hypothetical protein D8674_009508 [Pyrus ussuriensis x Pyrus communis]|uniref:MATH domain-containing protein n=1 Tax=Pyrus ussuriensis x Pyrus communis TaxID=2448454 RepID=A0A5N5F8F6_9ROSA|nr:hypothetical protein D8674_009508 [Pyrus ussuriensis x Pyrus communis]
MARSDLDLGALNDAFSSAQISKHEEPTGPSDTNDDGDAGGLQVTCFSEVVNETAFHLQIIRLPKQIYAWIGCNSAKIGHLYAAAPMRPADAEKLLVQKLINLGYTRPRSGKNPTSNQRLVRFHCQLFVLLIVEIDDLHGDGDDDGDGLSPHAVQAALVGTRDVMTVDCHQSHITNLGQNGAGLGTHISLHLELDDPEKYPGCKVFAEFSLRIVDQMHAKHESFKAPRLPVGVGLSFISLDTLDNSDRGFSVKDSCITEAVVTIRGTATAL